MLMNTAEQIILIILASALAVFLILAIIAIVQIIRLVKTLRTVAEKAQTFVDSADKAADMVRNAVGQLSVLRFVHSIFDMAHKHDKKDDK